MAKIGYARVSTKDQNLSRQIRSLNSAHCTKIFKEHISGKNTKRPKLQQLLSYIRDDDEVVVLSLDRLSRNSDNVKSLIQSIQSKGATLTILDMPSFKGIENKSLRNLLNSLMIDLFSYKAESERQDILERQRQGIAIAKEQGKYHGRPKKFTDDSKQVKKATQMYLDGSSNYTMQDIANFCNMSRSSVYRALKRNNLK